MAEYWFDSDSFINPNRGPFQFGTEFGDRFWKILEEKAQEGIIASSSIVLHKELIDSKDALSDWAKQQDSLFYEPDESVQEVYKQI
jgi:hypothetical protein